jgi:hypothetical protein
MDVAGNTSAASSALAVYGSLHNSTRPMKRSAKRVSK